MFEVLESVDDLIESKKLLQQKIKAMRYQKRDKEVIEWLLSNPHMSQFDASLHFDMNQSDISIIMRQAGHIGRKTVKLPPQAVQKALKFYDENNGKRDTMQRVWDIAKIERRFGLTPGLLRNWINRRFNRRFNRRKQ
jgi:hypothetical protein